MDPVSIASGLIAARIGQAQIAAAARIAQQQETANATAILRLLAAANENAQELSAAVQPGLGRIVDLRT